MAPISRADAASDVAVDSASDAEPEVASDAPVEVTPDLCHEKCEIMAQVLCPNPPSVDDCVTLCLEGTMMCTALAVAYFDCLIAGGAAGLACDASKHVVAKSGDCVQQSTDLFNCLAPMLNQ